MQSLANGWATIQACGKHGHAVDPAPFRQAIGDLSPERRGEFAWLYDEARKVLANRPEETSKRSCKDLAGQIRRLSEKPLKVR